MAGDDATYNALSTNLDSRCTRSPTEQILWCGGGPCGGKPNSERGRLMRIDYHAHPEIIGPMQHLGRMAASGTLEPALLELVRVRSSQLNGCAHCLEMHTNDAQAHGESNDRLHLVAAWPDAPVFNDRERAALRWCEELTLISQRAVPDDLYVEMLELFSEDELVQLTAAIVTINGWNRFAIAFRAPVGNYEPHAATELPS